MKRTLRALRPAARSPFPAARHVRLLAGCAGLLLAGCAGLQDLARSAFQKPHLEFRSASVDALDLEGATVGLHVDLDNPNGFGLDVARVAWTLDAEGTRVASGDMAGGLTIPAKGIAQLVIPVRVLFHDVPGIVALFTQKKDAVHYQVAGTVGVRTPVGVVELPVTHEGRLPLPGLPAFSIEGLTLRGASFRDVTFEVRLAVNNPNPFPIPAGKLDWTLSLGGGAPVARAEGVPLASVAAGGRAEVVIPVRLDLLSAGRAAADLARGAEVRVKVTGSAEVAGIKVPLDLDRVMGARR
jgi:LEA14-like dessication related protein